MPLSLLQILGRWFEVTPTKTEPCDARRRKLLVACPTKRRNLLAPALIPACAGKGASWASVGPKNLNAGYLLHMHVLRPEGAIPLASPPPGLPWLVKAGIRRSVHSPPNAHTPCRHQHVRGRFRWCCRLPRPGVKQRLPVLTPCCHYWHLCQQEVPWPAHQVSKNRVQKFTRPTWTVWLKKGWEAQEGMVDAGWA